MLIAFKSHREGILDRATNKRRKESQRDGISDKMNQFVRSKEYGRLAKRLLSYPKYSVPAGLNLPCSCNMLSKIPSLQYSISCVTITCYLKYRPAGIFTISGYYQAIGKNGYANIISIGRGFVFQFIFTIMLPPFIGTRGVFLSLPLAELITIVIMIGIIVVDKRKNNLEIIENC